LANPKQTFETFARIAEKAPDLKLCLSTNGLMLPAVNCVTPNLKTKGGYQI
jgi:MoaA/NifB/PqqE/SkfB family radical SAM enzyme